MIPRKNGNSIPNPFFLTKKEKQYTIEDLAYLAGLIDADGCISFNEKMHKYIKLRVTVAEKEKDVLSWIIDVFGGATCTFKQNKSTYPSRQLLYVWHITGKKASILLKFLIPYLKIKQIKAITMMGESQ